MSRIKLVIADEDTSYLHGLGNYLADFHAHIFEVAVFSRPECLKEYLAGQQGAGLVLITPELAQEELRLKDMTEIRLVSAAGDLESNSMQVFKYQRGPELVRKILQLYSECDNSPVPLASSSRKTRVTAVYSAAGGTGKTTLAAACSMQAAWEGKRVFYLNMENQPSTRLLFPSGVEEGLPAALYFLKDKKKSAPLRIETLKKTDPYCQIQYFSPSGNGLDLWEDMSEHLRALLEILSNPGVYDQIFIDLSSQLNPNSLALLEASEQIILVSTPDPVCQIKNEDCLGELERWAVRHNSPILERICPVLNKWEPELSQKDFQTIGGREYLGKIPWVPDLLLPQGNRYRIDLNSSFGTALYKLRTNMKAKS